MRETQAIIERVWQLDSAWQRLELSVDPSLVNLQPGQVVLALPAPHHFDPYLRELWYPVGVQGQSLIVERPLHELYSPGQAVSLLGAVGNPFPWQTGRLRNLLLMVQDVPPTPLLFLAQKALHGQAAVVMMLGGEVTYPMHGIPPAIEVVRGDAEQNWLPQTDVLQWAEQIYIVTDGIFWREKLGNLLQTLRQLRGGQIAMNTVYGVLDMPLPCGTGACMACMVRGKTDNLLACQQGLAFDLTELLLP